MLLTHRWPDAVHVREVGDVRHRRPVHLDLTGRGRGRQVDGLMLIQLHRWRRGQNSWETAVHLTGRQRLSAGQSHNDLLGLGLMHRVARSKDLRGVGNDSRTRKRRRVGHHGRRVHAH